MSAILLALDGTAFGQQPPPVGGPPQVILPPAVTPAPSPGSGPQKAQQLEDLGHRERDIGVALTVVGTLFLILGTFFALEAQLDRDFAYGVVPGEDPGASHESTGRAMLIIGGVTFLPGIFLWSAGSNKLHEAQRLRGGTAMAGWSWRF